MSRNKIFRSEYLSMHFRIKFLLFNDFPSYILPEWTVRPSFHFRPPQRHRAILWILPHMVYCRSQHWHRVPTIDYAGFMRRARWKAYQTARRRGKVGNYLEILQSPTHINWRNCVPSNCRITEPQYRACNDTTDSQVCHPRCAFNPLTNRTANP